MIVTVNKLRTEAEIIKRALNIRCKPQVKHVLQWVDPDTGEVTEEYTINGE